MGPLSGQFVSHGFHTHHNVRSEMWVLDVPYDQAIPEMLCQGAPVHDITAQATQLDEFGYSIMRVQKEILSSSQDHVMCRFRSHSVTYGSMVVPRSGLIDDHGAYTCAT